MCGSLVGALAVQERATTASRRRDSLVTRALYWRHACRDTFFARMPMRSRGATTLSVNLPQAASFPLRVGAVDIGSNAIRFAAAEFLQPGHALMLDQVRSPVRLGHEVFQTGRLAKPAMRAAIDTLVACRGRLEQLRVQHVRAVATSAVREGHNRTRFLQRVLDATGLSVDIITGAEELRLVHLAVRRRLPLGDAPWLLADLGGGSVEVSLVNANEVSWSDSHGVGAVRLLEELGPRGRNQRRFRRTLEEYVSVLRLPPSDLSGLQGFIATGGNIETLARLGRAEPDRAGVSVLPLARLRELVATLASLTVAERIQRLNLRDDRADVILPAALVYEHLCNLAGCDRIHVPGVGVKDGVLLDLVEDLTEH